MRESDFSKRDIEVRTAHGKDGLINVFIRDKKTGIIIQGTGNVYHNVFNKAMSDLREKIYERGE